ncbi:btb/poz domain-containing protein 19-like [Gigaspora margarita]|uniref:Btb/poz domain-containing protein 19-like n=1 Tax=Gigaspora margarita TaxID=4874 RepID=A0A8H4A3Y8_GIGMA|nr:btb/poz domain-containing protein 19-like [Gigaspora margarita]
MDFFPRSAEPNITCENTKNEDIKVLNKKLHELIELIKFYQMDHKEFMPKDIALLLTKWIDKKTIDDKTSKGFHYKFILLFRSSLDGFSSRAFHRKWDNKGATIGVVKDQNSSYLFGGYNPLDWNDKDVISNMQQYHILIMVKSNYAILVVIITVQFSEKGKLKTKSYPKIAKVDSLTALDYEVFQVVSNVTEELALKKTFN